MVGPGARTVAFSGIGTKSEVIKAKGAVGIVVARATAVAIRSGITVGTLSASISIIVAAALVAIGTDGING